MRTWCVRPVSSRHSTSAKLPSCSSTLTCVTARLPSGGFVLRVVPWRPSPRSGTSTESIRPGCGVPRVRARGGGGGGGGGGTGGGGGAGRRPRRWAGGGGAPSPPPPPPPLGGGLGGVLRLFFPPPPPPLRVSPSPCLPLSPSPLLLHRP